MSWKRYLRIFLSFSVLTSWGWSLGHISNKEGIEKKRYKERVVINPYSHGDTNRYKVAKERSKLIVYSSYWIGGYGKWSDWRKADEIRHAGDFKTCTGRFSDGYNVGYLLYESLSDGYWHIRLYRPNYKIGHAEEIYNERVPKSKLSDLYSVNLECHENSAKIYLETYKESCEILAWKYGSNYGVYQGLVTGINGSNVYLHTGVHIKQCKSSKKSRPTSPNVKRGEDMPNFGYKGEVPSPDGRIRHNKARGAKKPFGKIEGQHKRSKKKKCSDYISGVKVSKSEEKDSKSGHKDNEADSSIAEGKNSIGTDSTRNRKGDLKNGQNKEQWSGDRVEEKSDDLKDNRTSKPKNEPKHDRQKYDRPKRIKESRSVTQSHAYRAGYLGCYRDQGDPWGTKGRDLNGKFVPSSNMTIEKCRSTCAHLGYRYAGVQYGSQCFCGNRYGGYGKADNCRMRCNGDASEICGGVWANSVYKALANVKKKRNRKKTPPMTTSYEPGIDRMGGDYRNFDLPRADAHLCQEACIADARCKAWTYVRPNTIQGPHPRCWLKSSVPKPLKRSCCISGVKGKKRSRPIRYDTRHTKRVFRTFTQPKIDGVRLDWCVRWNEGCGKRAANAFCRRQGYDRALRWAIDRDIGSHGVATKVISTGQICRQSFCDGFRYIRCIKQENKRSSNDRRLGKGRAVAHVHPVVCLDGKRALGSGSSCFVV